MTVTNGRPARQSRKTMQDVAQLAGVSQQTVSRVLNGSAHVSKETIERVSNAVAKLEYRRNAAARALVTQRSMRLGVVSFGTSQFGPSTTLFSIVNAAQQRGYSTTLVSLEDLELASLRAAIDELQNENVDGMVVLAPISGAAFFADMMADKLPMVRFEPGLDNGTTSVSVDEVAGARMATRHLLELGHKSVWHVAGPDGWLGTEARILGWREELAAAGIPAQAPLCGDWSSASGFEAGLKLANIADVTAVFVANDQMALGLIKALKSRNIHVPEDISVVGFDDLPEAQYFEPALTTVRLDFSEVGQRCVDRLLDMIAGYQLAPQPAVPPELIVRASAASVSN